MGDPDTSETILTGYILEVGDRVLFNEKITKEEFEDKTEQDILDEYYLSSIFLSIESIDKSTASKLEFGQKVKVVITGGIAESAPAQATADSIEIIEE
ncbi:DUF3221 domain-containing protein [Ferdinandcohnia sp. Marseille-Q9671]